MRRWGPIVFAAGMLWMWCNRRRRNAALPLTNKVVIVTGASAGIGRALAQALAAEGAHLVLVARREALLAELAHDLESAGHQVLAVTADITEPDSVQAVVEKAVTRFGRIDVLINNAGTVVSGAFSDYPAASIRRTVEVNVLGTLTMTQPVVRVMHEQKYGHIVNIASVAGALPNPGFSVYGATKAALLYISDTLAQELADDNIFVTQVLPGWVATDMLGHMAEADMRATGLVGPINPINTPEQLAQDVIKAIHERRERVINAGLLFKIAIWSYRHFPVIGRAAASLFIDHKRVVEITKRHE